MPHHFCIFSAEEQKNQVSYSNDVLVVWSMPSYEKPNSSCFHQYRWCGDMSFISSTFLPVILILNPSKSLKAEQSEHAVRLRFHNGTDAFSTPSSTPQTPSSWPPRPALTGLSMTCVAGRVVSFLPFLFAFELQQNHHQSLNCLCVMSFCLERRVLLF